MSLLWPWMLVSLLLLPLSIGLYLRIRAKRRHASADLGPLGLVQTSKGGKPGRWRHIPAGFFLSGLTLLLLGLSRPEIFIELPRVEGTVILVFDISQSMAADDLEPSRLEAAKAAARTFVENQPNTIQIGVVAFSRGGLVIQPPAYDTAVILTTIERLQPEGATSLGQGVFSALNAISGEAISLDPDAFESGVPTQDIGSYPSSVILLFTDGENTNSPDPLAVAQLAADAGVRIYPVGIGSSNGAVLDLQGYNILTQLNEPILEQIAELTNGVYYPASDAETLDEIYKEIDLRLEIRGEKMEVTAIFAGASLILFLIGGVLSMLWFGRMPL